MLLLESTEEGSGVISEVRDVFIKERDFFRSFPAFAQTAGRHPLRIDRLVSLWNSAEPTGSRSSIRDVPGLQERLQGPPKHLGRTPRHSSAPDVLRVSQGEAITA